MAEQQKKNSGKNQTTSPARKLHYQHYAGNKLREKHKVIRVLKASGMAEAERYAREKAVEGHLRAYVNRKAA